MHDEINRRVNELSLSEETKEFFIEVIRNAQDSKTLIPSVHLVKCNPTFAKVFSQFYADILIEYGVCSNHTRNRYIRLCFPVDANEEQMKNFLQCIDDAAITSNRFCGVILLDIINWDSSKMQMSKMFNELMKYFQENKKTLHLVLCTNAFDYNSDIVRILRKHLHVVEIKPIEFDTGKIHDWIENFKLEHQITWGHETNKTLERHIVKLYEANHFYGEGTLIDLMSRVCFEKGKDVKNICEEEIEYLMPVDTQPYPVNRIGF